MKTKFENQLINIQMKDILVHLLLKKQVYFLLLFLSSLSISAQETTTSANSSTILDEKAFIEALRVKDLSANSTYSRAKNLEDLLYNIQPSVYLYSGVVNSYGEKPKNLFTSITSLSGLTNPDILRNNIQIATIRIDNPSDLNSNIDLSAFDIFKNLKYIYIISTVNTTAQHISTMIQNNNEGYNVFYTIQIGDNN
jgi:hypothetical protein